VRHLTRVRHEIRVGIVSSHDSMGQIRKRQSTRGGRPNQTGQEKAGSRSKPFRTWWAGWTGRYIFGSSSRRSWR
jgi:hypothetical protein